MTLKQSEWVKDAQISAIYPKWLWQDKTHRINIPHVASLLLLVVPHRLCC